METNKQTFTYEEAYEASLNYFDGDQLAARVWVNKYAMKDSYGNIYEKTPADMHWRIANEIARVEQKYSNPMSAQEVFDLLDHMTASYFMPIGGLLIVLFVGWKMKRADVLDEMTNGGTLKAGLCKAILFIIRYLAPVAIAVIFISQLAG